MSFKEVAGFIDRARIYVEGGRGGDGMRSFRREKYVPLGGPDGGNGGKGGDVWLVSSTEINTLLDFKYKPHFKAQDGQNGKSSNQYGKDGEDIYIKIPVGTVVYKNGDFFYDFDKPDEKKLIASGGRGGRGNKAFKTHRNTAPHIYEKGQPGESATLDLELKLIADIGIVGLPNAGKSTFLAKISNAHPKIDSYPFTTLTPNLGVTSIWDKKIVFADIPGLIEGAHEGKGLGHEFLRHIERTKALIHIVDGCGFGGVSPLKNYKTLLNELKLYSNSLLKKPMIVAFNKIDLSEARRNLNSFKEKIKKKHKVFPISAVTGEGIKPLLECAAKMIEKAKPPEIKYDDVKKFIYEPPYTIKKENDVFVISGKKINDLVEMTDFENPEALSRFQNILKKMGLEEDLIKLGATPGATVKIGKLEFEFLL